MMAPPRVQDIFDTAFSNTLNESNQTIVGIDDPSPSELVIGPWAIIYPRDLGSFNVLSQLIGATIAVLTGPP